MVMKAVVTTCSQLAAIFLRAATQTNFQGKKWKRVGMIDQPNAS